MSSARELQTATLLPDGEVLEAGGDNPSYLSSAELYDPSVGVPAVTAFSPTSDPVGKSVTITGRHLAGATAVWFNGVLATFTVVSDMKITAKVPKGALTGFVAILTPAFGTAWSSTKFKVVPEITSFTPTSGPPGTLVTVYGSAFTGATKVRFNGFDASFFEVKSYSKLIATCDVSRVTPPILGAGGAGGKLLSVRCLRRPQSRTR